MNIAPRLIHICMVVFISAASANYVGKKTAAKIETIYAHIVRELEAATR